eukprot:gene4714-23313_t
MVSFTFSSAFVVGLVCIITPAQGQTKKYTLTGRSDTPSAAQNARDIEIDMLQDDLNAIKQMVLLATAETNTFLSLSDLAALDMNNNAVEEISETEALKVTASEFIADASPPTLLSYSLNMNTGDLKMTFSEPIETDSVQPTGISFQQSETKGNGQSYTLKDGTVSTVDSTNIDIVLKALDLNALKSLSNLATADSSTYITIDKDALEDMSSNGIDALSDGSAKKCRDDGFTQDTIDPSLTSYDLNMNDGTLTFLFDESMDSDSFTFGQLQLQNTANVGPSYCPCEDCEANHYIKADCTNTFDTLCQECKSCGQGEWQVSACAERADTVCQDCGACGDGKFVQSLCAGSSETVCGDCGTNCKTCGGSGDLCTECISGFLDDGACIAACPTGYYGLDGECLACDGSCKTCSGAGNFACTGCNGNSVLANTGECKSFCDGNNPGKYRDTSDTAAVSITAEVVYYGARSSVVLENNVGANKMIDALVVVLSAEMENQKTAITRIDTTVSTTPEITCVAVETSDAFKQKYTFTITVDQSYYEDIKDITESVFAMVCGDTCSDTDREDENQYSPFGVEVLKDEYEYFEFANQLGETVSDVDEGTMCDACHGSCTTCFGSGVGECTTCDASDFVLDRTSCVSSCPTGTYASSGSCITCPAGCSACDGASTCTACEGSLVLESGKCRFHKTAYPPSTPPSPPAPAQNTARPTNCDDLYSTLKVLTGTKSISTADTTTVVVTLSTDDLNDIKVSDTIAKGKESSFISFTKDAIADMADNDVNPVASTAGEKTLEFTVDSTPPRVTDFTFDMHDRELTLVFDEPVRESSLSITHIHILNDDCLVCTADTYRHGGECIDTCPDGYYAFSGNGQSGPQCKKCHSTCMTCSGGAADQCSACQPTLALSNGACASVCATGEFRSNEDDRYVTVSATLTFANVFHAQFNENDWDQFGNYVKELLSTALENNKNSRARDDADIRTTVLSLNSQSSQDPNDGTKTIVAVSIQVDQAFYEDIETIFAGVISPGVGGDKGPLISTLITSHPRFTEDVSSSAVTVPAAVGIGNMCKACDGTCSKCTGEVSTTCTDCPNGKFLYGGKCENACPAGTGLDTELDECVACASTGICFSCKGELVTYSLTSASTKTTTDNGLTMTVALGRDDVDAMTAKTDLATADTDTFIAVSSDTVDDMAGKGCAQQTLGGTYTEDKVKPVLESFRIDMNSGELYFTFSETINGDELKPELISIRSQKADLGAVTYDALQDGTITTAPAQATVLVLKMVSSPDLDALKAKTALATKASDTFVKLAPGAIVDMNGNENVEIISDAATAYVVDSTKPTLSSFDLDMNDLKLKLTFSETVLASSLTPTKITLQYADTVTGTNNLRKLTAGSTKSTVDSTKLTIDLNVADANAIKAMAGLGLTAGLSGNTFITFEAGAVTDMALPIAMPIDALTTGQAAANVVADGTDPKLVGHELDMHDGILTLEFSETVKASTLLPRKFTIHGGTSTSATKLRLTEPATAKSSTDSTILTITLNDADMNALKKDVDLAKNEATTVVSADVDGVEDMATVPNGLAVLAVDSVDAKIANVFKPDSKKPTLTSFKLDMNLQKVFLTFSETMKASTLLGSQIKFYSTNSASPKIYPLSGGTVDEVDVNGDDDNNKILTLTLSSTDFNALAKEEGLSTGTDDTFITLTPVVEDMNTNQIAAITAGNAKQASFFAEDERAATLDHFDLDLTTETLTLVFSETMDVTNLHTLFDATKIVLQSGPDIDAGGVVFRRLIGEIAQTNPARADSATIVVNLLKDDLEAIKSARGLATGGENDDDNTWIAIANELVSDQSGVAVTEIGQDAAKRVRTLGFNGDSTKPVLESFTLDMANGKVVLSFTETMEGDDVTLGSMSIQNVIGNSPSASVPLGDGTYVAPDPDSLTVEFVLSDGELNAVKKATNLGTDSSNTFIKLQAGSVKDMASNGVTLTVKSALSVGPDTVRPTVTSMTMSMITDQEAVTIVFDETMKRTSIAPAQISLQNTKVGGDSVSLDNAVSTSDDGTSIVVLLTKLEVDELKRLDICVSQEKCFLTMSEDAFTDMAAISKKVVAVEATDATVCGDLTLETTAPELKSFESFNYDTGILTLSFSEPILPGTINPSALSLHGSQSLTGNEDPALGTTASVRGTILELKIHATDLNAIKGLTRLCKIGSSYSSDCSVRLDADFIKDTFNNNLVAVTADDNTKEQVRPKVFQADTVGPLLEHFHLDMEEGFLDVTFDEPVEAHKLVAPSLTFQDSAQAATTVTLEPSTKVTDDPTNFPEYGLKGRITLTATSILAIKAAALGSDPDDTFVSLSSGFALDLQKNPNIVIPSQGYAVVQADSINKDVTDVELSAFSVFDTNAGSVKLKFNEPVDILTISYEALTIQSKAEFGGAMSLYKLKNTNNGGSIEYSGIVASKQEISITMDDVDRQAIQNDVGLAVSVATTFVSFSDELIKDVSGNKVKAVLNSAAAQAVLLGDIKEASLQEVEVDLTAGAIKFKFSTSVDTNTFKAEFVTVQSSQISATTSYTLTEDSTTSDGDGFTFTVGLCDVDLNGIKATRGLATGTVDSTTDTFVSITTEALRDISDRAILPTEVGDALPATKYNPDTTAPTLEGAAFNLDGDGTLTLSFSEVIDISTKDLTAIVIQDAASPTVDSVRLTGGTIAETDTSKTMTITLEADDLNAIKHVDGLAVSKDTTYISVDSTLIDDMTPNAITAKVGLPLDADGFGQDNTAPTVEGFDLDMKNGMLYLTFSETVELDSLTATGITFQDHKTSPTTSYTLKKGVTAEVSATELTITLDDDDLNGIKVDAALTPATTIFMIFAEDAVTDPKPNGIAAIPISNAVTATLYTPDDVDPTLESFELSMNTGLLKMHFSETIKFSSFSVGQLVLSSDVTSADGVVSYTISDSSVVLNSHADSVASDYTTIVIQIHEDDMNAIKNIPLLANNQDHTHISFPGAIFTDVDSNPLVAIASTAAKQATGWVADSTPPELVSFSLNMNDNTLTLNFNEPVDDSIVDYTAITIQSKADINDLAGTTKVRLGGVKLKTRSANGMVVTLSLLDTDINKKTKDAGLAISDSSTFISMADTFINDMASVDVKPIADTAAQQTPNGGHTPDTTRPQLDSWDLDMTTAKITFHFLETINVASFKAVSVTLQKSQNAGDDSTRHTLQHAGTKDSTENGLSFTLTLNNRDMNDLKLKSIGKTAGTSWLVIAADTIEDMNSKQVIALVNNVNAKQVNAANFEPDSKKPTIDQFAIDMDGSYGTITLTLSETVHASTFDGSKMSIFSANKVTKDCPCSSCFSDEFVDAVCTTTEDTVCELCQTCGTGTFKTADCTDSENTVCQDCGLCGNGKYITALCSGVADTSCADCADNCATCTGPGARCTECDNGYQLKDQLCVLIDDGLTARGCGNGFYGGQDSTGAQACFPCYGHCQTCAGPEMDQCHSCYGTHSRTANSGDDGLATCENACTLKRNNADTPTIEFRNPVTTNCDVCHASCSSCNGHGATDCLSCPTNKVLEITGECAVSCSDGSFAIGSVCHPCTDKCAECSGVGECATCTEDDAPVTYVLDKWCFVATVASETERLDAIAAQNPIDLNPHQGESRGDLTCTQTSQLFSHEFTANTAIQANNGNSNVLVIDISKDDSNKVKALASLAVSDTSIFVSLEAGGVQDMDANDVDPLDGTESCYDAPYNAGDPCFGDACICTLDVLTAALFQIDATNPELDSFSVNMDATGSITMTFTETIDVDTIQPAQFSIQWKINDATESVALTGSSVAAKEDLCYNAACSSDQDVLSETRCGQTKGCKWDATAGVCGDTHCGVVIDFTPTETLMNTIKSKSGLAVTKETSYLSILNTPNTAVQDMIGRDIEEIAAGAAKIAFDFDEDETPPAFKSFDLDIDQGKLIIYATETIHLNSVVETRIFIQDGVTASTGNAYRLTAADDKSIESLTNIVITLSSSDLNNLKQNVNIGTREDTTYIRIEPNMCTDTNNKAFTEIQDGSAKRVDKFKAELVNPTFESAKIDLTANTLTLSFSETVSASSIVGNENKISLTTTKADQTVVSHTFATLSPQANDADVIVLGLDVDDLNAIKKLSDLCVSQATCNVKVEAGAFVDMSDNQLDENTISVDNDFKGDLTSANLDSFELNLKENTLTIQFDETVDVSKLEVDQIQLHSHADSNNAQYETMTLSAAGSSTSSSQSENGVTVVINLGTADLNAIKERTKLAHLTKDTVFLTASATAIKDMNGRPLVAIAGKPASDFTGDDVNPTLDGFTFNLNTRTVTLQFSESMKAESLVAAEFVLQNNAQSAGDTSLRAVAAGVESTTNSQELSFVFSETDADMIKIRTSLCTHATTDQNSVTTTDCYIRLSENAAMDMNNNKVVAKGDGSAIPLRAGGFTADDTRPELEGFDFEMSGGTPPVILTLSFSETVLASSLDVSFITLMDNVGSEFDLNVAVQSQDLTNPSELTLTIQPTDLAGIRATKSIGRTTGTTWIKIDEGAITDHATKKVETSVNPIQVSSHTVDVTPPRVVNFDLDFGTNEIILYFSEAVVESTLNELKIAIQSSQSNAQVNHFIRGAASKTQGADASVWKFEMEQRDIDAFKANSGLAVSGGAGGTTWLTVDADVARDIAENVAESIDSDNALQVQTLTADNSSPNLLDFQLNMDTGVFTLTFDEVVSHASVTPSGFTLQNAATNPTETSEVLDGSASTTDSTVITLTLTLDSANGVRALTNLATDKTDTWLAVDNTAFKDVDNNQAAPVVKQVNLGTDPVGFTADTSAPLATGFKIDLDEGTVTVSYQQPVNGATVDPNMFTLENKATGADSSHDLSGGTVDPEEVATSFVLKLSTDDLNDIKEKAVCAKATAAGGCFLRFKADSVDDATGQTIAAIDANTATDPALTCTDYTADGSAPTLATGV